MESAPYTKRLLCRDRRSNLVCSLFKDIQREIKMMVLLHHTVIYKTAEEMVEVEWAYTTCSTMDCFIASAVSIRLRCLSTVLEGYYFKK